jgi:DNA-binding response OmpR family regulator
MNIEFTRCTWIRHARLWIADPQPQDYDSLAKDRQLGPVLIRSFSTAEQFLRVWTSIKPDACLINVRLPDLSGFEVVKMLWPFPPGTLVGLVSDRYVLEDEVRALSLGVHSYLCKPLEATVFFELCLCPRTRREAASHAAASRWAYLPPAHEANLPANCKLRNAERRLLD